MILLLQHVLLLGLLYVTIVAGQVCSPPGQLCTRTTDCCKGCCEAHVCVDRSFPCSNDLIQQPGFNSCIGYYCPVGQICYLREVCPPENPCPRQPVCRRVDMVNNYSNYQYRNSFTRTSAGPAFCYISLTVIILTLVSSTLF